MMQATDWRKHSNKWKHLHRIDFPSLGAKRGVDMLFGIDYAYVNCAG